MGAAFLMAIESPNKLAHGFLKLPLPCFWPQVEGNGYPCGAGCVEQSLYVRSDGVSLGGFVTRQATIGKVAVCGVYRRGVGRHFLVDGQGPVFITRAVTTIAYAAFVYVMLNGAFEKLRCKSTSARPC